MQGYTRRQLKEDKFVESAQTAADWASGHRRSVLWGIGVIVVAALAYFGITTWLSHQSDLANAELGAAVGTLTNPLRAPGIPAEEGSVSYTSAADRAKAAEKQFQAVADKYSYLKAGKVARYLQGVSAEQAGDNATAEQQLKAASDSNDKSVAALAKMALASLYRSSNRQSDAIRIYKELEDHPTDTVSKVQVQLAMAEMYESTDPQQASILYQQIQQANPASPAAQIAASRMAGAK